MNCADLARQEKLRFLTLRVLLLQFEASKLGIHQSLLSQKLVYNGGFQTLNCRSSFEIQLMWPKFRVALVTRHDLFS